MSNVIRLKAIEIAEKNLITSLKDDKLQKNVTSEILKMTEKEKNEAREEAGREGIYKVLLSDVKERLTNPRKRIRTCLAKGEKTGEQCWFEMARNLISENDVEDIKKEAMAVYCGSLKGAWGKRNG